MTRRCRRPSRSAGRRFLKRCGGAIRARRRRSGAQYWDGRSSTPLDGTDARLYADAAEAPLVGLPVPLSRGAVREVLADRDASDAEKRAALMRALDYFGVPADAVRVPPPWWRVGGRGAASEPATRPYAELSARELARALRTVLRAADDADGKKI